LVVNNYISIVIGLQRKRKEEKYNEEYEEQIAYLL